MEEEVVQIKQRLIDAEKEIKVIEALLVRQNKLAARSLGNVQTVVRDMNNFFSKIDKVYSLLKHYKNIHIL